MKAGLDRDERGAALAQGAQDGVKVEFRPEVAERPRLGLTCPLGGEVRGNTPLASATLGGTQRTVRWPVRVEVAVCSDSGEAIRTVFTGWAPASSARSTSTSVPSSAITLRSC